MRIFLIGFMGSGKTHWGKQVAQKLSLPFYDLDEVIVAEEKRSVPDSRQTSLVRPKRTGNCAGTRR